MTVEKERLEKIVLKAIDNLRPYLEQDGGDMEFVEITDDNIVRVRLLGNCSECQMSIMTMRNGIAEAIKEVAPEIIGVEAINGPNAPKL